jgi:hypothetical protein
MSEARTSTSLVADLVNGGGVHFVAWISNSTTDAIDLIQVQSTTCFETVTAVMMANNLADLIDGSITAYILDQFGNNSGADVVTGTDNHGVRTTDNCNDWTTASTAYQATLGRFAHWSRFDSFD